MLKKTFMVLALTALCCGGQAYSEDKISGINAHTSVVTLSPKMKEAIVQQIAKEQYSSNLYMTFASYFADEGLDGCEAFFRNSSKEEAEHAIIFCNELMDRQEKVQLKQVNAVAVMPTSPLDAFKKLVENEMEVTRSIHNLYSQALEEKDFSSQVFLHWFLLLQVQEEKEAQDLLQLLSSGASDPAFIISFDEKLREMSEED